MIDYGENVGDNIYKYFYTINSIKLFLITINAVELVKILMWYFILYIFIYIWLLGKCKNMLIKVCLGHIKMLRQLPTIILTVAHHNF